MGRAWSPQQAWWTPHAPCILSWNSCRSGAGQIWLPQPINAKIKSYIDFLFGSLRTRLDLEGLELFLVSRLEIVWHWGERGQLDVIRLSLLNKVSSLLPCGFFWWSGFSCSLGLRFALWLLLCSRTLFVDVLFFFAVFVKVLSVLTLTSEWKTVVRILWLLLDECLGSLSPAGVLITVETLLDHGRSTL